MQAKLAVALVCPIIHATLDRCRSFHLAMRAVIRNAIFVSLGVLLGWCLGHLTSQSQIGTPMVRVSGAEGANVETPTPEAKPSMPRIVELVRVKGLRADVELSSGLQVIRAEDFRDFAALWTKDMRENVNGNEVRVRAILDRWFKLDPISAKDFAEDVCKRNNEGESIVAECAARCDPKWALEHLLNVHGAIGSTWQNSSLMSEVTRQDPALAKEWVARFENTNLPASILRGYVGGLAKTDPMEALKIALAAKAERGGLINWAIASAASEGAGIAMQMLEKIDDTGQRQISALVALSVLINESQVDPFRFLEDTIGTEHLSFKNSAFQDCVPRLVEKNPEAAVSWAASLPVEQRSTYLKRFLSLWNDSDPESAIGWIQKEVANPATNAEVRSFMEESSRSFEIKRLLDEGKMQDAIALVLREAPYRNLTELVARKLAQQDPAAAGEWVATLPASEASASAARSVAATWNPRFSKEVGAWVERLPAGLTRDGALSGMVPAIATVDAERASHWVALFSDQNQRESGISQVFEKWVWRDPGAALDWLRGLPEVDDQWKARLIKRSQP
jgi:hypothetical protein